MAEERCKVTVHGPDRWPTFHECGRKLKPGFDKCGIHVAADQRRAKNDAAWRAERAAEHELSERLARAAAEFEGVHHVRVRPYHDYKGNLTGEFVISEEELRKLVKGRG